MTTNSLQILLIEDNSDDAELIVMELERAGWQIDYSRVQSRDELSSALRSESWDLAISDFTLPEFNGVDAMSLVKKEDPELPFIIVSGTIGEEQAVDAVLAGAGDYIMKDNINRLVPAVSREIKNSWLKSQKEESEQRFKALTEGAVVGVYMIKDEVFEYVNPKFAEIAGYERDELIGKMTPYEVVHTEDHEIVSQIIGLKDDETRREHSYELRGVRKDGEIRYIEIFGRVVKYPLEPVTIGTIIDITDRMTYEQQLQESLKEKEVLLQEIHHRVKNNLAVITGMLSMQADEMQEEQGRRIFYNAQMRIKAMARIHEKLYQAESLSEISFNEFLSEIVEDTIDTFTLEESQISFHIDSDPVVLNINQALPCAQIINELIMNSIRHAFEDSEEGRVDIELKEQQGKITLSVSDNGSGLPEDFDFENPEGMGSMLVNSLKNQLKGELQIKTVSGTRVLLTFPKA